MDNFEEKRKKVDETWKETIEKERGDQEGSSEIQKEYPQEINFALFLSSLMVEGLIALGEVENPITKKKEASLPQARYVIDVLSMLEEKTKNNLMPDEKTAIEHILYELRMKYVSKI